MSRSSSANNEAFTQGKLKHLHYDEKAKTLHFKKTNDNQDEELQHQFYEQLPLCDIADVLRFVNGSSCYSLAFTHIQPRYSKIFVNENGLIATIIAQALNNGNLNMADISDIPYDTLLDTYQSRLHLRTLKQANDIISDDISKMPIFPLYSLDMILLYASLDGQKYEVTRPTIKARYSKKYYGKGKGVVAYTMLYNHIPLQSDLIGAHDHESYYAFDIWYNNTSSITPNVLTGDMHVINQYGRLIANAIIHYNSAILSKLKIKYEAEGNHKALARLKRISPVAWRHIHFQGHFIFSNKAKLIELDMIVNHLVLQSKKDKITTKNKQDIYALTA